MFYRNFVDKRDNPEMEELSGSNRNMWKCITMSINEKVLEHSVWIHVVWEFDTTA